MKVTLWGTRGSLATPGPETVRYGGNTSCVEVRGADGTVVVLDAGTGIRRLGGTLGPDARPLDVLLTHLHMDHIQGLGFFRPLYRAAEEVHIWGPPSTTLDLRARAQPLPVAAAVPGPAAGPALPPDAARRAARPEAFGSAGCASCAALVCHPGPTVGYRISEDGATVAYIPDHEPRSGPRACRPRTGSRVSTSPARRPADPRRPVHARRVSEARRLGAQRDPDALELRGPHWREAPGHLPPRPGARRRSAGSPGGRGAQLGRPAVRDSSWRRRCVF